MTTTDNANGQPRDLFAISQHAAQLVHELPLTAVELDELLTYLLRFPAVRDAGMQHLEAAHFHAPELGHAVLWAAFLTLSAHYDRPDYDMLASEISHRCQLAQRMSPDGLADLLQANGQGLVWLVTRSELDGFVEARGFDLLRRFLHERKAAGPLNRILAQSRNGTAPRDMPQLCQQYLDAVEEIGQVGQSATRMPRKLGQLRALRASGALHTEQLVQGVLAQQGLAILHGDSGIGKTLLLANLDLSLATGTCFLEHPEWTTGDPIRVGLYSIESGPGLLTRNIENMLAAKRQEMIRLGDPLEAQIEGVADHYLDVITDRLPDIGDPSSVRAWIRECKREGYRKVTGDPLFDACGSLANDLANSAKVYPKLDYLVKHAEEAGVQIQFGHHNVIARTQPGTKAKGPVWPTSRDIGYPVFRQAARQIISVATGADYDEQHRKSTLHLAIAGKGNISGGSYVVTLEEGRQHTHWRATATPRGEAIEDAVQQQEAASLTLLQQQEERVLAAMTSRRAQGDTTITANAIKPSLAGLSIATVTGILQRLTERGSLTKTQVAVGSRTYSHYSLISRGREGHEGSSPHDPS